MWFTHIVGMDICKLCLHFFAAPNMPLGCLSNDTNHQLRSQQGLGIKLIGIISVWQCVEPCGVHHNKEQTSLRVAASDASQLLRWSAWRFTPSWTIHTRYAVAWIVWKVMGLLSTAAYSYNNSVFHSLPHGEWVWLLMGFYAQHCAPAECVLTEGAKVV